MTLPLTLAEARTHIETDLGDPALQRLIDDADATIVGRYGAHVGPLTELVYGDTTYIYPRRRVSTVTSITEFGSESDTTGTVLAANNYRVELGGRAIRRLTTGASPSAEWNHRASIVYTPLTEVARRERVEVDLVRLAAQYEAKTSETIGDYSATHADYEAERDKLLGALGKKLSFA